MSTSQERGLRPGVRALVLRCPYATPKWVGLEVTVLTAPRMMDFMCADGSVRSATACKIELPPDQVPPFIRYGFLTIRVGACWPAAYLIRLGDDDDAKRFETENIKRRVLESVDDEYAKIVRSIIEKRPEREGA